MCNPTYRRIGHGVLLAGIFAALQFARCTDPPPVIAACELFHVTGYTATGGPTADGSSTDGAAWMLAAAHPRIPFGTRMSVAGLGTYRVADRGWLGPNDLDILVDSASSAYALTGEYPTCYT